MPAHVYEIWGQEDEDNQDCNSTNFNILEIPQIEADTPAEALQKFMAEGAEKVASGELEPEEAFPPPANGTHWHFKVIDAQNRADFHEYSLMLQMVPAIRMFEMGEANSSEHGGEI